MFDWYWHLRLWFWWNYSIKKDEFSPKLGYWKMYDKYKKKPNYSVDVLNSLIVKQRNIAHRLEEGENIKDIAPHLVEWARI